MASQWRNAGTAVTKPGTAVLPESAIIANLCGDAFQSWSSVGFCDGPALRTIQNGTGDDGIIHHKKDEYLSINPKGQVPAIRFDDGDVLAEGTAILS
ncbi:hypothetical protein [Croceicoccus esteveae]|uniref:hypothetical protein n=1 Tax=Croceicoccus esteveae TaxID=3075597 RepID=UPI003D772CEA